MDSINYSQIKEIALNSITDHHACIYYTEYGYYKIELIIMDKGISGSELYSESILIDNPYDCKDLVIQEKLNSILKQIHEILNN